MGYWQVRLGGEVKSESERGSVVSDSLRADSLSAESQGKPRRRGRNIFKILNLNSMKQNIFYVYFHSPFFTINYSYKLEIGHIEKTM